MLKRMAGSKINVFLQPLNFVYIVILKRELILHPSDVLVFMLRQFFYWLNNNNNDNYYYYYS